jgi:hypothetical protein
MSLDWDISDISNYEKVCWLSVTDPAEIEELRNSRRMFSVPWRETDDGVFQVLNPVTNALIWLMMSLGLKGEITAQNAEEAVLQVMIEQRLHGALLQVRGENGEALERYITPDEVRAHVGLKTNCFGPGNSSRAYKEKVWQGLRKSSVKWVEDQVKGGKS